MTERWQRELKKLDRIEMPSSLGSRIEAGPTGEKLPARRQRIVAGVVAFAVFGAAGAFAFQALRNRTATRVGFGGPDAVVELQGSSGLPPTASLSVNGVARQAVVGPTCWDQAPLGGAAMGSCFDWPPPTFSEKDYLDIPVGTKLRLAGNATVVSARVFTWNPGPPPSKGQSGAALNLGYLEGPVPLLVQPGNYVLTVTGRWSWSRGTSQFFFAIRILPTS